MLLCLVVQVIIREVCGWSTAITFFYGLHIFQCCMVAQNTECESAFLYFVIFQTMLWALPHATANTNGHSQPNAGHRHTELIGRSAI